MFDLKSDPIERKNLSNHPSQAETVAKLKAELARLKKEVDDKDEFADKQPSAGVDGAIQKLRQAK